MKKIDTKEKQRVYNRIYYQKNKEKQRIPRRAYYQKNREKIRIYHRAYHQVYYQKNRDKISDWYYKTKFSPNRIWIGLKGSNGYNKRKILKEDFIDWYKKQKRVCVYCGISEKELKNDFLKINRKSYRLQIDRMDNNKPYIKGNLALACRYCNEAKSNIFSYEEMKKIGKIIKRKRTQASS